MGIFMTPEEVCKRYGISIYTLYQWTSQNRIPHLKVNGKLLFREQDLIKWEESMLVTTADTKLL